MRRKTVIWLMAFAMTIINILSTAVAEESSGIMYDGISTVTTQPYNVMILIDKSGSMNGTDGGRISLSAACQFVDELCENYGTQAAKTSVGVMAFSQTTELLTSLVKLDTEVNTSLVKAGINSIVYNESGTGGTDLGTAVNDAALTLQSLSAENDKNMIVMFTDGYSERVLDEQAYQNNLENAFQISAQMGMEVYIVGLNYQNKITADGKNEIWRIADTAQTDEGVMPADVNDPYAAYGKVNYLITDSMNDVREFYGQIHACMSGSEIEYIDTNQFSITTSGVIEADITVYSQGEIFDVAITAPDGTQMQEDGVNYVVKGDMHYKVIKIMNPQIGIWTIDVSAADSEHKTYLVRVYGVEVAVSALCGVKSDFPDCAIDAENVGRVTVTPLYRGTLYQDESFAAGLTQSEFTASSEGWCETYPLQYDSETGQLIGYFPVSNGSYHIQAVIATASMSRSAECDLNVNLVVPTQSFELNTGITSVKKGESAVIDLSELSGGIELTITSCWTGTEGKEDDAKISAISGEGSVLSISGVQPGTDTFEADAVDNTGNQYHFAGYIQVEDKVQYFTENVGILTLSPNKEKNLDVQDILNKEGLTIQSAQLEASVDDPVAELKIDNEIREVCITALKTGADSFRIIATDNAGNQYTITGKIRVEKLLIRLWPVFAAVAVFVIVGIIIFLKKRRVSVAGEFTIEIIDTNAKDRDGSFSFSRITYPKTRSFSLWKLISEDVEKTQEKDYEMTDNEKAKEELCEKVRQEKKEIEKKKIVLSQTVLKRKKGKKIVKTVKGVYKLQERDRLVDLGISKCCYESNDIFKINIQFEQMQEEWDDDDYDVDL